MGKATPYPLPGLELCPSLLDGAERSLRACQSGTPDSHRFRDVPPPLRRPAFALPGCLQGFLVLAAYAHRLEPGYRRRRSCLQAQTAGRIGSMHNGGDVA